MGNSFSHIVWQNDQIPAGGYYTSQRMRQQPNKISKTLNPLLQSMEPFGHVHIPNICGVSIVVVIWQVY